MGLKAMALAAITVSLVVGEGMGIVAVAAEAMPQQAVPEVLTLEKAVELAVSNHPSLRVASGTQAVNEAKVGQAQSGFFPQLQARSAYQQATANNATSFGGGPSSHRSTRGDNFGTSQNSVTLNQLLYDFGKIKSQVDAAQFNLRAANSDAETTLQTVIVNVQQAYFGLQQAQRLVKVSEEAITQFKKHLDLAMGRFKAGVAPKIDVTTAEVDSSNAQLNLITARNNAQVARVTLNNAMGIKTSDGYRVDDPTAVQHERIILDEAVALAMRLRPEMISQQALEQAAEVTIKTAQSDFFPTVSSSANYSYTGQESPFVYNWNVTGTVNIPIFSGFLTKQQVAEARANLLKTKASGEVLRQNILLEVNQALLNLEAAKERLQVTAVTVTQAKERLALVEGRYRAGLSNAIEVTDAEVALVNAQVNDVVAMSNYQAVKAQLDRATGISTSVRGGS
jgi:TolC family type I secretion outer membrane protein